MKNTKRNFLPQVALIITFSLAVYCASNYFYWSSVCNDTRHPSLAQATDSERFLRSPWRYISDLLPKAMRQHSLAQPAANLAPRINQVEQFVADELSAISSVTIVCILNDHGGSDTGRPSQAGHDSQALTMKKLQDMHADLVGVEGSGLDLFICQDELDDMLRRLPGVMRAQVEPVPSRPEVEHFYNDVLCDLWAVRRYMRDNAVRGIGIEDEDLHALHALMLPMQDSGEYRDSMTGEEFFLLITAVHDARSDLALARIKWAARGCGASAPALGIGAEHGRRIRAVTADFGVPMIFHECKR